MSWLLLLIPIASYELGWQIARLGAWYGHRRSGTSGDDRAFGESHPCGLAYLARTPARIRARRAAERAAASFDVTLQPNTGLAGYSATAITNAGATATMISLIQQMKQAQAAAITQQFLHSPTRPRQFTLLTEAADGRELWFDAGTDLRLGDVLRCHRTGENMAVSGPSSLGTLTLRVPVTRSIGALPQQQMIQGDVLLLVGTGIPVGRSRPGLGEPVEGAEDPPLVVEPVLGWRAWKLYSTTPGLHSVSHEAVWPVGEPLSATCQWHQPHADLHAAPDPGCSCGIYLPTTFQKMLEAVTLDDSVVVGVAKGWGRCVQHETGWRVEKCYPAALIATRITMIRFRSVIESYRVPVKTVTGWDQLLDRTYAEGDEVGVPAFKQTPADYLKMLAR